ncbi:UNVERIFIED_CONTAM: Transmembrane protein [Trichonephila clavipes]
MTTVGELGIGLELMSRYVSPVNPAVYPHLTLVLLGIGLYEVTSTKFTRDVFKELLISLVAAVFLGFGILFLLLWVGIYTFCIEQETNAAETRSSMWTVLQFHHHLTFCFI